MIISSFVFVHDRNFCSRAILKAVRANSPVSLLVRLSATGEYCVLLYIVKRKI